MKRILGLDLGTNSIGWALVDEAQEQGETSEIIKLGVRVNPLTADEKTDFEKGKPLSTNADRTLKRGARRNLQRFKLRREVLIELLIEHNFITKDTPLTEIGKNTSYQTLELRAKAAKKQIELEDLAKVFLTINKKRGYKSSRKAKNEEEGQTIDGMSVAKELYDNNLTVGQYVLNLLENNKKYIPDFYRSDLQAEFDKVWQFQQQFYPEILDDKLYKELQGNNKTQTWAICKESFNLVGVKIKENDTELKGADLKKKKYELRSKGISEQLNFEFLAIVLQEINNNLKKSSGYLGAISDRSKELYFNKETVGENLWKQIQKNRHTSLKNQVFYRQDYLDEFEQIWETQAQFYPQLTTELKEEIRDVIIFYQRKLKSQKGLLSFCEFESWEQTYFDKASQKEKKRTIGRRVISKSSPLFQEFKIWQNLNNVEVFPANEKNKKTRANGRNLTEDEKWLLYDKLFTTKTLEKDTILQLLDLFEYGYDINYSEIKGNETQYELFEAYKKIVKLLGCTVGTKYGIDELEKDFKKHKISTKFLKLDKNIAWNNFEKQPMFQLWHLLYSYEDDKSKTGKVSLINKLSILFNLESEYARILSDITFSNDYGNLSSKAIKKIMPHLIKGEKYNNACALAGYNHSHSLTKEENEKRELVDKLDLVPKNSLRNPVVEKILNQMINVVNQIIDEYGKLDEIRVELARELKKNTNERLLMNDNIDKSTKNNKKYKEIIIERFGIPNPTKNDIIRYKLWEELGPNGYKPIYGSNENLKKKISPKDLFTGKIEIEHILPKALIFDDSFSNKTLVFSSDNKEKGNMTAWDYVQLKGSVDDYLDRIITLFGNISKKKVYVDENNKKKIKTKNLSFTTLFRNYSNYLNKSKIYKKSLKKWDSSSEEERKKLKKPWKYLTNKEQKLEIINKYYTSKLKKLTISKQDLPDGFIERDLRNSQYIAKKAKDILQDLVQKKIVSTSGSITDKLREDWDLINIMKELNLPKYKALGLTEFEERLNKQTGELVKHEVIKDWTKRNDHRHHAMDALTVAFTTHNHVQYLNNLNARKNENHKKHSNIIDIEKIITKQYERKNGKKKRLFIPPMENFRSEAKKHIESILISIKNKNKVVTRNVNKIKGGKSQETKTPRGQLHKETVYGKSKHLMSKPIKLSKRLTLDQVNLIANPIQKELVLNHLKAFENNPIIAFDTKTIKKTPILYKGEPLKEVICYEEIFTIRKDISSDLKIDKVIDKKVQEVLRTRLAEFDNQPKEAFSNLDKNPIWLNKEKGISIKRVTIIGVSNAEPLHYKKDHLGNEILDEQGKKQAVDFVSTGNNHHVAIYQDKNGILQEKVMSFYEAVTRVNQGLPVIDKEFNSDLGWQFLFTMKQNEMFIFPNEDFDVNEIDLLDEKNASLISKHLFRVQKIGSKDYWFRHHLETTISKNTKFTYHRITSTNGLYRIVKVRINHIGKIVQVGEY